MLISRNSMLTGLRMPLKVPNENESFVILQ